MAGATNRQLKAAGLPKATRDVIRINGSRGMTLQSAIQVAERHGAVVPEKARKFLERRVPAAPPPNPALEKMRASKANVATLRAQRDARRENMKRMRKRVDFARETKQLRAAFTPEHQRAIDKAESGYGPMAALRGAKQLQKRAIMDVRAARTSLQQAKDTIRAGYDAVNVRVSKWKNKGGERGEHMRQILKDGPSARAHLAGIARRLEDASAFRGDARSERQHATRVKEGYALRDMAETRSPFERKRIKKETGYAGPSAPKGARAAARSNPFNMAKHLTKRIALTEKLASKLLNFTSEADTLKTKERFKKSQSALLRLTASRKQ